MDQPDRQIENSLNEREITMTDFDWSVLTPGEHADLIQDLLLFVELDTTQTSAALARAIGGFEFALAENLRFDELRAFKIHASLKRLRDVVLKGEAEHAHWLMWCFAALDHVAQAWQCQKTVEPAHLEEVLLLMRAARYACEELCIAKQLEEIRRAGAALFCNKYANSWRPSSVIH